MPKWPPPVYHSGPEADQRPRFYGSVWTADGAAVWVFTPGHSPKPDRAGSGNLVLVKA